jgi:hypothetical protein
MENPLSIRRAATAAAAMALACGTAWGLPPGVRAVNHAAAPGGNGQSWSAAYQDLQDALAEAKVNPQVEQIWVAVGTYGPANSSTPAPVQAATFDMQSGLALYGGFVGSETQLEQRDWEANVTILSGEIGRQMRSWHVVTAEDTDLSAVLDGFTVTGGSATELSPHGARGGGILILVGTMTARNCIIRNNWALHEILYLSGGGGGVSGQGTFENCRFESNYAGGVGGGVHGGGTFADCAFVANSSTAGGGAFAGSAAFINCLFQDNHASSIGVGGGAILGSSTFTDCEFLQNRATFNAGAINGGGTFTRCTFVGNAADSGGFESGTFNFIDCHLERNRGHHSGFSHATINAINTTFVQNDVFCDSNVDAVNCTFVNNGDGFGYLFNTGTNTSVRLVNCLLRDNRGIGVVGIGQMNTLEIVNSTLIRNSRQGLVSGPAVSVHHSNATAAIHNSILWDNGGTSQNDQIHIAAGSVDIQNSVIQGWDGTFGGTDNHGFDPVFADTDGRLSPGSPAIDAGNNALLPAGITTDLDGNPRFVEDPGTPNNGVGPAPIVDIGAYEFQGQSCYANCDRSTTPPILNIDDFICFVERFAQGHPLANCDGSTTEPILTVEDFMCFAAAFAAGCP